LIFQEQYEAKLEETSARYIAMITETDKHIQQLQQFVRQQQALICQKQLNIAYKDYIISEKSEQLEACKRKIDFIERQGQEKDEHISTLQLCKVMDHTDPFCSYTNCSFHSM
jgi:uncharacterized protein (DUF3084 family)